MIKKSSSLQIIIKNLKVKHTVNILKCAWEKCQVTFTKSPIRVTDYFSFETLQARKECRELSQVLKEKSRLSSRVLYPAKLSLVNECWINIFPNKFKDYIIVNALQMIRHTTQEIINISIMKAVKAENLPVKIQRKSVAINNIYGKMEGQRTKLLQKIIIFIVTNLKKVQLTIHTGWMI